MFISPALASKMATLFTHEQKPMPIRTNYSASDKWHDKQRKLRERGYGRRALRANVALWALVLRFLKATLAAMWAKVVTPPQPLPADQEWPAGEYVSFVARWAGKPI